MDMVLQILDDNDEEIALDLINDLNARDGGVYLIILFILFVVFVWSSIQIQLLVLKKIFQTESLLMWKGGGC